MSLKYCPDIWKNIFVRKIDHERVDVGFCCQNNTVSVSQNNWHKIIAEKRQNFVNNDWPQQCHNCWQMEVAGAQSKRHAEISWYACRGIVQDNNPVLKALEWNSENLCNLACITCGPVYSSRWSSEIKKYPWQDINRYQPADQNRFFEKLDLSSVERVYFNGGEPLMCQDHVQIIQHLCKIGVLDRCEIAYNTNGTTIPDSTVLDLWRQARLVRVFISIDAIENSFEFIRWPAKWQQIINFLSFLKSQPFNIIIDLTCTLGIHNIFSLHTLRTWQVQHCSHNHQGDPVNLNLQLCGPISHGGKVLALDRIGARLSNRVISYLDNLHIGVDLTPFRSTCERAAGNDLDWVSYLDQVSAARKMDWKKHLPELAAEYHIIS
jgi:hypothetical protein